MSRVKNWRFLGGTATLTRNCYFTFKCVKIYFIMSLRLSVFGIGFSAHSLFTYQTVRQNTVSVFCILKSPYLIQNTQDGSFSYIRI